MSDSPNVVLADWLDSEACEIREIEGRAYTVLHHDNDESAYRELMRSKALRLASLAENGLPLAERLELHERAMVVKRMKRFSTSASTALNIGSVFFMSALLYPDGYEDGQKNDLEIFAQKIRSLT
ncbi:hypothetical protein [Maridesulfovibrio zosterae]|uniref:hypothetical protein n=1 Tax=Maridesulfovibrio zosterae TaxID=82171 RepID=UPI00040E3CBB|nr:hypothetical protein [Maridesulfovibrio zosterae]